MGKTTLIEGVLQIDHERGVVYFHASNNEVLEKGRCPTPLRIQGIGVVKDPLGDNQIDIGIRQLVTQRIHTRTGLSTPENEKPLYEVMISKR